MGVANQAIEMQAPQAARQRIVDDLQPFLDKTNIRPFGNDVLIAVYTRAGGLSAGGVYIPESNREDEFQGITGLIIEMGPMASNRHPDWEDWFGDHPPKKGDWIGFNVRDGVSFKVGSTMCRMIEWKYLRFGTDVPDAVM